jgi:DNA-binding response OmpR family regulator
VNSERIASHGRDGPLMISGRKGDDLMTERKCFVFRFADVEVGEREFLLTKAGERIQVEPKAFRVLLFLLRNPGRLIPKDEIMSSVWNDSAVSDNSLTRSFDGCWEMMHASHSTS